MWAGTIDLVPVGSSSNTGTETLSHSEPKSRRASWHAFTHVVVDNASVGTSAADATNSRTVRLKVVPPEISTVASQREQVTREQAKPKSLKKSLTKAVVNPEKERVFHVHAAILRAYSPVLAARFDEAVPGGLPPEEIVFSQALAETEKRLFVSHKHAGGLDWTVGRGISGAVAVMNSEVVAPIAAGSGCVAVTMKKKMEPEMKIVGSPALFKVAIDWMYGRDLNIKYADMIEWADDGCELLVVAQNLGIDSLVYALRRIIIEATTRGGPRLAWAMLQVCHRHDLQAELRHACNTIARAGAYDHVKYLSDLPLELLSILLSSTAWIVDSDDDLLDLVDYWVKENFGESQTVDADVKSHHAALPATSVLYEISGKWNIRWGALRKGRLEACVKANMIPYSLLVDCQKWLEIGSSGEEYNALFLRKEKEQLEAAKNKKEKAANLVHCEAELAKCYAHLERLEARVAAGEDPTKDGLGDAISSAKRKLQSLRMQVAVAADNLTKADADVWQTQEAGEQSPSYKPKMKLSEQTVMWRFPPRPDDKPRLEDGGVHGLLGGIMKRGCPVAKNPHDRKSLQSQSHDDDEAEQVDPYTNTFVTTFCPWLRRRRCHHVVFSWPRNWKKHFDIVSTDRDRTLIRLKATEEQTSLEKDSSPSMRFIGDRLFKRGRHEFLIRISRRVMTDSESFSCANLTGLQFGVAKFDLDRRRLLEGSLRSPSKDSITSNRSMSPVARSKSPNPAASPRSIGEKGETRNFVNIRETARKVFSSKTPPKEFLYADMDFFSQIMEKQPVLDVTDGSVVDMMLLVVVENNRVRWAVDQVVCNSSESAHFLLKHKSLHRWSDELKLEEDLKMGCLLPSENDDTMLAMALEINPMELQASVGSSGSVDVEVLPQEALYHSWWIEAMDRSADGQPHYGQSFTEWGPISDWAQS